MKLVRRVTCDRNPTAFCWMLKLPVTSHRSYDIPTIFCEELEDFTNFHGPT